MNSHLFNSIVEEGHFVLGEYTTDSGPFIGDHFVVLVSQDGRVFEISTEGSEAEELIKNIEKSIKKDIKFQLCNVTNFDSRVLYPDPLCGEPLFELKTEEYKVNKIFQHIKNFGVKNVSKELSNSVLDYLQPGRLG